MRPIAVIGAAGFIGSALVRTAARAGIPYTAFTRATPFLDPAGRPVPELAQAQTIYWLASSINPALAEAEPARIEADRARFEALVRAARELPERPRVVLLSSGGTVYDPTVPPPYGEHSPTAPRGAYGRAKLALEELLRAGLPGRGLVLRASNVYGPGQPARAGQGVVAYWMRALAAGEPITIIGDTRSTRDYIYLDDVVDGLLAPHAAATVPAPVVNIGSGTPTSLGDLAELVQEVAAIRRPVVQRPARGFDVARTWLDVTLAARVLSWKPGTPLRDGLAATWAHRLDYDGAP